MQRKSNNSEIKPLHKKLSIQFSLDGFSFCITDSITKKVASYVSYTFDITIPTPELLLERVTQLFKTENALQQDFEEITVIHQNNLSTLVPNEYFDENKLKSYLDYNIKTLADDYIVYDDLKNCNAKTVYIPFVNINNYLFQNFGEFEFTHHSSILIDKLLSFSKNKSEKQLFVNVSVKNLDIVITKGTELLFYNTFQYNSKEDFIYYILFVAEQLELNTNEIKLTFMGAIEQESEIYKITHDYVRNTCFIETSNDFFNTTDDFSNHSNYILVS